MRMPISARHENAFFHRVILSLDELCVWSVFQRALQMFVTATPSRISFSRNVCSIFGYRRNTDVNRGVFMQR